MSPRAKIFEIKNEEEDKLKQEEKEKRDIDDIVLSYFNAVSSILPNTNRTYIENLEKKAKESESVQRMHIQLYGKKNNEEEIHLKALLRTINYKKNILEIRRIIFRGKYASAKEILSINILMVKNDALANKGIDNKMMKKENQ